MLIRGWHSKTQRQWLGPQSRKTERERGKTTERTFEEKSQSAVGVSVCCQPSLILLQLNPNYFPGTSLPPFFFFVDSPPSSSKQSQGSLFPSWWRREKKKEWETGTLLFRLSACGTNLAWCHLLTQPRGHQALARPTNADETLSSSRLGSWSWSSCFSKFCISISEHLFGFLDMDFEVFKTQMMESAQCLVRVWDGSFMWTIDLRDRKRYLLLCYSLLAHQRFS